MRALVFILVLANALFFAYAQGYFGRPGNPDADRLLRQVKPEGIRVVSRGEAPAAGAGKTEANNGKDVLSAGEACLAWRELLTEEAEGLATLLGEKFADFKVNREVVPIEGSGWWVFIPPLPGKAEAERKVGELKQLGVKDYFIVQEPGPNRFAISLGIFSNESGAQDHLAGLRNFGVRSAKAGPRGGKDPLETVEVRGPAAQHPALTAAVAALLPEDQPRPCQ